MVSCRHVDDSYLVHSLKGIVVLQDSFLVETVAIDFHRVAFLVVASHLGRSLVVVVDTCAAKVALDNFLEDFYETNKRME